MSWSKAMSEIGPMSSRSRFRWRMTSCANANGIAGSRAQPIATDTPSGTSRATASRIAVRLSTRGLGKRLQTALQILDRANADPANVQIEERSGERHEPEAKVSVEDRVNPAQGEREAVRSLVGRDLEVRPPPALALLPARSEPLPEPRRSRVRRPHLDLMDGPLVVPRHVRDVIESDLCDSDPGAYVRPEVAAFDPEPSAGFARRY